MNKLIKYVLALIFVTSSNLIAFTPDCSQSPITREVACRTNLCPGNPCMDGYVACLKASAACSNSFVQKKPGMMFQAKPSPNMQQKMPLKK